MTGLVGLVLSRRGYRPATNPAGQMKIDVIRQQLQTLGVATGQSHARTHRMTEGTQATSLTEALEILRSAHAQRTVQNDLEPSVLVNAQVRLLKEQSNGIRSVLLLPHPELLVARPSILVFASPQEAPAALAAGALIVGGEELVPALMTGDLPVFNRCLATTTLLPSVMKVARILGPRGLMPSVKTGTLVEGVEIAAAVERTLQTVPFKIEKCAGLLNMSVGKVMGETGHLAANVRAVVEHLNRLGSSGTPGSRRYIDRLYLSMRGHPGIRLNLAQL